MTPAVDIGALALSLLLCVAAAGVGGRFRPGDWYARLRKSRWTPPALAFPIVWSLLYALMAIAAWWVWRRAGLWAGAPALAFYLAQLLCNALWSWLFFGLKRPTLALLDLVMLWLLLVVTVVLFWRHSVLAATLLLPYLAWATFAAYLNAYIVWRN